MAAVATVTITLHDNGQLNVEGDIIQNKMAAYGILELAKEAVSNMHAQAAKNIQEATPAERLALIGARMGTK